MESEKLGAHMTSSLETEKEFEFFDTNDFGVYLDWFQTCLDWSFTFNSVACPILPRTSCGDHSFMYNIKS